MRSLAVALVGALQPAQLPSVAAWTECQRRIVALLIIGQLSAGIRLPVALDPSGEGAIVSPESLDLQARRALMLRQHGQLFFSGRFALGTEGGVFAYPGDGHTGLP